MRPAPLESFLESGRAEVRLRRGDDTGVREHAPRLQPGDPTHGVVGVRADVSDAASGRQLGVVAPGEGHVVGTRVVPAIDDAADLPEVPRPKDLARPREGGVWGGLGAPTETEPRR